MTGSPLLVVEDVAVNYGRRRILSGVNLRVAPGEWHCLVGPNGSGKTTLLRCISGQVAAATGAVRIEGAKRSLGYAHPPDQLPGLLSGRQCLQVYAAAHELPQIGDSTFDLASRLNLVKALDSAVNTYSLGMRQKLSILLALIADPRLIVLDEAFNGLDPMSGLVVKQELRQRLASRSCAILLATHALDIVSRYATHASLLLDGTLRKTWSQAQLAELRAAGPESLESALANAVADCAAATLG